MAVGRGLLFPTQFPDGRLRQPEQKSTKRQRPAMSFAVAAGWFISASGLIILLFERVEKYSSKADLDLYYLLLTVKRKRGAVSWNSAVSTFFDKIFDDGRKFGPLFAPRLARVLLFSFLIYGLLVGTIVILDGLSHRGMLNTVIQPAFVLLLIQSIIIGIFSDYI